MYKEYFKYVVEHRRLVRKECFKMAKTLNGSYKIRLIFHGLTHDLSKFKPSEFIPYAKWINGEHGIKLEKQYTYEAINNSESCLSYNYLNCKADFQKAWKKHYKRNRHHWKHYYDNNNKIVKKMPAYAINQMICDLNAMGTKFGNSTQEYYLNSYDKIKLFNDSRLYFEHKIGLDLSNGVHDICYWCTIKENILNNRIPDAEIEEINKKYNIDLKNAFMKGDN